jgi:carbon monoxide dehydrogenase subunit G
MQITGTNIIAAPGLTVWNALNDPDILRRCLPGCESVERIGAEDFKIIMTAAVGPLKARFNGKLRMTDARPPSACVLHFEGQGGAMGFGKGTSTVSLREVPEGTELTYTAEAQIGGKLAQVGSRLIDGVARKMSDDFFKAFRDQLAPPPAAAPQAPAVAQVTSPPDAPELIAAQPVAQQRAPVTVPAALAPAGHAVARSEAAGFMVPAWWLAPAASIGAIAAIAGALLTR